MECHESLSPTETSFSPVTFGKPLQRDSEYDIVYLQRFTARQTDRQKERTGHWNSISDAMSTTRRTTGYSFCR